MHCWSHWPTEGTEDPGAFCSLPEFQGFRERMEDVFAEVMPVTFPWLTSVSNLYLPRLDTFSIPSAFFLSSRHFSPFRRTQLHNLRQGATSDQTKEKKR